MSTGNKCIVVTGLMRSGTSLMMQCLQSAGVRCLGSYPGFEDDRSVEEGVMPTDLMLDAQGGAVKILEPHCRFLPPGFDYHVISTRRSHYEQAKSYVKMARSIGERLRVKEKVAVRRIRGMLREHQRAADAILASMTCPVSQIVFESLVADPEEHLGPLSEELGLDLESLIAPVIPRNGKCHGKLLELELSAGSP